MTYDLIQKLKQSCPDAICTSCHGEGVADKTEYAIDCGACNKTGIEPGYEKEVEQIKNNVTI